MQATTIAARFFGSAAAVYSGIPDAVHFACGCKAHAEDARTFNPGHPTFEDVRAGRRELCARHAGAVKPGVVAAGYAVGDAVEVHAFGHWYRGQVVKVGRARVTVRYTSGTGRTRDKAVNGDLVRRATPWPRY